MKASYVQPVRSFPAVQTRRSVFEEFADDAAVAAAGLTLPLDVARVVLILASRMIGEGNAKVRGAVYYTLRVLAFNDDAIVVPSPKKAHGALGATGRDITLAWNRGDTDDPFGVLPVECVLEFLPAPAWAVLADFVALGPRRAGRRLQATLDAMLESELAGTRELPAGRTYHHKSLRSYLDHAWRFMGLAVQLREDAEAELAEEPEAAGVLEVVRFWEAVPRRPKLAQIVARGASGAGRDVSAVPYTAVAHWLREYARAAEFGKWPPERWPRNKNLLALRKLVVLALAATVCPRIDTLRLLDVEDFDERHEFEDGSVGPALRFRGDALKLRDGSTVNWKPLPASLAQIIKTWILGTGRELGGPGPLIVAGAVHEGDGRRIGPSALSTIFSGRHILSRGKEYWARGLVPLSNDDQYGYASHRFRHFAVENVEKLVHEWKLREPTHELAGVSTETFGEVLLDHADADMGYRDLSWRRKREKITRLAVGLLWDFLWGTDGRRRGLDPEEIVRAREAAAVIAAELKLLEVAVETLELQEAELLRQARGARGDRKLQAFMDAQAIGAEIRQKLRRELRLTDEYATARLRLDAAQRTEVVLAQEWTDAEYDAALAAALGDEDVSTEEAAPLADELKTADVAELFAVAEMTIRRWRSGTRLPSPAPFDVSAWYQHGGSAKDWRLPVSAVNVSAIPAADPRAALDAVRRRRAAIGFGRLSSAAA